jgi:sugar phosphate isomerase/epimerase
MKLALYKTLWGHDGNIVEAAQLARDAGFKGIEGPVPDSAMATEIFSDTLSKFELKWIQEICTAGSYVPRRHASIEEHLRELETKLKLGKEIGASFANVIGGCDAWEIDQSVRFFSEAQNIADRLGVICSFETHRGRSFFTPWNTVKILDRLPELKVTCDFSHWAVVCERLMDSEWDSITRVAQQAHHVHGRVGYDQGPQVPHPGAPEYAEALASHQRCWESIWASQLSRAYTQITMTPEFGPDGYLHTLPFTNAPIADLWELNRWMATTERQHFEQFTQIHSAKQA